MHSLTNEKFFYRPYDSITQRIPNFEYLEDEYLITFFVQHNSLRILDQHPFVS